MSYTIDVYRRKISAEKSWVRFSLYIAFFPQLVAGPIVRASDFLPQLKNPGPSNESDFETGIFLLFKGLFKKVVIADFFALYATALFSPEIAATQGNWLEWLVPPHISAELARQDLLSAWIGMYSFAFQIYYDFSGYTDIARGSAMLIGYRLPENFKSPYLAESISDFWRRWHITLSSWLRDYLYISLGGNRGGKLRTLRNLMVTMTLGGLWHGAAWTFVLWGFLHGALLSAEKMLKTAAVGATRVIRRPLLVRCLKIFITFHLVSFLWVIFRARSLDDALRIYALLTDFGNTGHLTNGMALAMILMMSGTLLQALSRRFSHEKFLVNLPVPLKSAGYAVIMICMIIASGAGVKPFIYFQF